MRKWRKVLWRSELQKVLRQILSNKEMTLVEVVVALQLMGITIDLNALAMIVKYTAGIYVVRKIYSSSRPVNVYSSGIMNMEPS